MERDYDEEETSKEAEEGSLSHRLHMKGYYIQSHLSSSICWSGLKGMTED